MANRSSLCVDSFSQGQQSRSFCSGVSLVGGNVRFYLGKQDWVINGTVFCATECSFTRTIIALQTLNGRGLVGDKVNVYVHVVKFAGSNL